MAVTEPAARAHRVLHRVRSLPGLKTHRAKSSDKKIRDLRPRLGLNKRLNRRFRKQDGGLLIRGSEVRILPGALRAMRDRGVRWPRGNAGGNESGNGEEAT